MLLNFVKLGGLQLSGVESIWVRIFLGRNFPGGNCPGWEFSGWELSWELSWVWIFRVGIFFGGSFPGGNCPVGIIRVAICRVGVFMLPLNLFIYISKRYTAFYFHNLIRMFCTLFLCFAFDSFCNWFVLEYSVFIRAFDCFKHSITFENT